MKHDVLIPSIIVAVGLVIAALLNGGLYELRASRDPGVFMWRVNKLTGATYFCSSIQSTVVPADKGCLRLPDYATQAEADAAIASAYLAAHPEEAPSFGVKLPTPAATPSTSGRH
jgi:hypothetical protein